MIDPTIINLFVQINLSDLDDAALIGAQSYEDIRQVFRDAIADGTAVRFIYERADDPVPELRTLSPGEIVGNGNGEESVLGHDHDRDFARRFRLDRISAVDFAPDVEPYRV